MAEAHQVDALIADVARDREAESVGSMLGRLGAEMTELDEAINRLSVRLEPLLRPSDARASMLQEAGGPSNSRLVADLEALRSAAEVARFRLVDITDRIDL